MNGAIEKIKKITSWVTVINGALKGIVWGFEKLKAGEAVSDTDVGSVVSDSMTNTTSDAGQNMVE